MSNPFYAKQTPVGARIATGLLVLVTMMPTYHPKAGVL